MTGESKSVKGTAKSCLSLQIVLILFTVLILTFNVFVLRDQIKQHRQFRFGVAEKKWRSSILNHWKEEVQQYASDRGQLPASLYDVATNNPDNLAGVLRNWVMKKELFAFGHPIYTLFLEVNAAVDKRDTSLTHPCSPTKRLT